MGGLIFILPILAFDVWLACTTGKRQWWKWREAKDWSKIAGVVAAGILLAVFCAFFVEYKNGTTQRIQGFPVPFTFSVLENGSWTTTTSSAPLAFMERLTNFVSGLVAPLIPFKVAEFLQAVKKEIQ